MAWHCLEEVSNDDYKVYAILGDGELQEGQVWENSNVCIHYKLDNLIAIIDNNGLQIDGRVTEICSPEPITDKFKSFGWHTILMDAHDFDDIEKSFQ